MTIPTAAERAAAIFPDNDVTTFRSTDDIRRDIAQAIADAEAAARADEREACCKDMCRWCREGYAIIDRPNRRMTELISHSVHGVVRPCAADPIRARSPVAAGK